MTRGCVAAAVMRVFVCRQVQGAWWLEADMRLQCFGATWSVVAVFAVILLVVYTAGLPLGISLWLRSRRHSLDSPETVEQLGFLCVARRLHVSVAPRCADAAVRRVVAGMRSTARNPGSTCGRWWSCCASSR